MNFLLFKNKNRRNRVFKNTQTLLFVSLLLLSLLAGSFAFAEDGSFSASSTGETQIGETEDGGADSGEADGEEADGGEKTEVIEETETGQTGEQEEETATSFSQDLEETPENENVRSDLRLLYEGALVDEAGTSVPDGRYNMRFTVFDAPQGGEVLWQETHAYYEGILVNRGRLRVVLGRENPLSLDFGEAPFFLATEIGEEKEEGIEWSGQIGERKEITTLSALLDGKELTEDNWAEVERMLREKGGKGELIVLMDMASLGGLEQGGQTLPPQFFETFKKFIDFLSERMSEIGAKLNTVLEELEGINTLLVDMKGKIDELHAALVVNGGGDQSPASISDSGSEIETKDTGRAIIQEGEDAVKIVSSAVTKESKVFITFFENPNVGWWVSQKAPSEFFVVSLRKPAEKTLEFDYWVVEGDIGTEETDQDCVPEDEICDGLDNDCDGEVDENLERSCGQGTGLCESGVQVCSEGAWGECQGAVGPEEEICDGQDNDCDGEVDEDGVCPEGEQAGSTDSGDETASEDVSDGDGETTDGDETAGGDGSTDDETAGSGTDGGGAGQEEPAASPEDVTTTNATNTPETQ